jgi:DNA topoisomerase VI subunit B/DNA-binding transcriptional regulator YdaS (Cro superfamily)
MPWGFLLFGPRRFALAPTLQVTREEGFDSLEAPPFSSRHEFAARRGNRTTNVSYTTDESGIKNDVGGEAFGRAKAAAGNAATLAHKLGVTRQALSQWEVVPMLRVLDVERITGIPRHELRPDMHPPYPVKSPETTDSNSRLREYINGRTQTEMAERIGCSKGMLSLLISGERRPSLELARRIAQVTDGQVRMDKWRDAPSRDPLVHPGESPQAKAPDFTNCGKAETQETPIKQGQKKLTRVPFTVSRLMEFCSRKELVNQTGHDVREWSLVVVKELLDNALDHCEEVGIAPAISIEVQGDKIIVEDNGHGIPAKIIEGVLDYSIRVSSREAYCSPTRGQQGNALKCVFPMSYVLNEHLGEDASGTTIIESHGIAHRIEFAVDHIKQEPKIARTTERSSVTSGTRITVTLPAYKWSDYTLDLLESSKPDFLCLAESYAWLNPHLTLKVIWNSVHCIDIKATNPAWSKWLPSWPTSAHWYDTSRGRRYMAAHIAHRGKITVREFISEFDGMSSTAKQKMVLAETGASHVSLHEFFGLKKANADNIARLLAALKKHTKPARPAALGIIRKEHLFSMMEASGGDPKTFTYKRSLGETNGIPHVVEFAFGIHRDGLGAASGPRRKIITGVNFSPGINNPFRQLGHRGESLDSILANVRANTSQPVIAVLHLACPRVAYTDRGKSAIVVEGEANDEEE